MISDSLKAYLSSSDHSKYRTQALEELGQVFSHSRASDIETRKKSAQKLSHIARQELSWRLLCLREWFLDETGYVQLFDIISCEKDVKTQASLLRTLRFFCERMVFHPMWEEMFKDEPYLELKRALREFMQAFISIDEMAIKFEAASILAMLQDGRAWDMLTACVNKKPSYLTDGFSVICPSYAPYSMNAKQRTFLIETLQGIAEKTKNNSVRGSALRTINKLILD